MTTKVIPWWRFPPYIPTKIYYRSWSGNLVDFLSGDIKVRIVYYNKHYYLSGLISRIKKVLKYRSFRAFKKIGDKYNRD